jgi:hypothetical protein
VIIGVDVVGKHRRLASNAVPVQVVELSRWVVGIRLRCVVPAIALERGHRAGLDINRGGVRVLGDVVSSDRSTRDIAVQRMRMQHDGH